MTRGYTLFELLVVIVVLALLILLGWAIVNVWPDASSDAKFISLAVVVAALIFAGSRGRRT